MLGGLWCLVVEMVVFLFLGLGFLNVGVFISGLGFLYVFYFFFLWVFVMVFSFKWFQSSKANMLNPNFGSLAYGFSWQGVIFRLIVCWDIPPPSWKWRLVSPNLNKCTVILVVMSQHLEKESASWKFHANVFLGFFHLTSICSDLYIYILYMYIFYVHLK